MYPETLYTALETVEEMLEDRNYIPVNIDFTSTNIINRVNDRLYITPSGKLATVVIVESTSQIKNYSSIIDNKDYETVIFVYLNNLTVAHRSIEKNLNFKIEIWSVFSLLVNVSKHFLQPKIEKVDKLNLDSGKLPKISFYDPIVRYYKYKQGNILKITDREGFVMYRKVV